MLVGSTHIYPWDSGARQLNLVLTFLDLTKSGVGGIVIEITAFAFIKGYITNIIHNFKNVLIP